jgi:hypothetical protein
LINNEIAFLREKDEGSPKCNGFQDVGLGPAKVEDEDEIVNVDDEIVNVAKRGRLVDDDVDGKQPLLLTATQTVIPQAYNVGDDVVAQSTINGRWYPARIAKIEDDGYYTISWKNGIQSDMRKSPDELQAKVLTDLTNRPYPVIHPPPQIAYEGGVKGPSISYSGLKECGEHFKKRVTKAHESFDETAANHRATLDNLKKFDIWSMGMKNEMRSLRRANRYFVKSVKDTKRKEVKYLKHELRSGMLGPRALVLAGEQERKMDDLAGRVAETLNDTSHVDGCWESMDDKTKHAWKILGWDEIQWDRDERVVPDSAYTSWQNLTQEQREAAKNVGFDEQQWDEQIQQMDPCPGFQRRPPGSAVNGTHRDPDQDGTVPRDPDQVNLRGVPMTSARPQSVRVSEDSRSSHAPMLRNQLVISDEDMWNSHTHVNSSSGTL